MEPYANPYPGAPSYNQTALAHYRRAQHATEPLVTGSFEVDIFSDRYQRNNKRGGLKNLRCFPTCGKEHRERGFCGRPVTVQVRRTHSNVVIPEIYCWAEFVKVEDSNSAGSVKPGDRVSHSQVLTVERNKGDRIKPWMRGELIHEMCTDDSIAFEFNRQRWGWHYGWTSNKHACNHKHALQCYVFQPISPGSDTLVCLAVFQSPHFVLYCRRRKRNNKTEKGKVLLDSNQNLKVEGESKPTKGAAKPKAKKKTTKTIPKNVITGQAVRLLNVPKTPQNAELRIPPPSNTPTNAPTNKRHFNTLDQHDDSFPDPRQVDFSSIDFLHPNHNNHTYKRPKYLDMPFPQQQFNHQHATAQQLQHNHHPTQQHSGAYYNHMSQTQHHGYVQQHQESQRGNSQAQKAYTDPFVEAAALLDNWPIQNTPQQQQSNQGVVNPASCA